MEAKIPMLWFHNLQSTLQTRVDPIAQTSNPTGPFQTPTASRILRHQYMPQLRVVIVDSQLITAGYTPTIVSSTYIALHTNGDIVLAVGKTFAAGDQGPTIDSEVVSLGSTALTIRTPTVPLGAENSSLPSVATIAADKTVTLVPSGIIVQNANLTSNGPAVTASGTASTADAPTITNSEIPVSAGSDSLAIVHRASSGLATTQGLKGLIPGGLNGASTAAPGTSSTSNGTAANITWSANGPIFFPRSAGKVQSPGGGPPERLSNNFLKRRRQLFGHLHSGRQPRYRIRRARSVRNQLERDPA
ncbi:hypothetical protein HO173_012901 [Letharia columbiana]|uniref:Uncharacterized protein n=1 Tax=Letharia columbiana TaxID=112416 RepID=A0A8H6FDS5_9LECA|nr:uncharacterized protein HO173_012901 [Letharia columbiana]KAF6224660.1 hypothetical protein HO173_012901 [Letharia columbiana]